MCFADVHITNTRTFPHEYDTKEHYEELGAKDASSIVNKFAKDLYDPEDFNKFNNKSLIYEMNSNLYDSDVDRTFIDFKEKDFAKIYNVENEDYINRQAKVEKNASIN